MPDLSSRAAAIVFGIPRTVARVPGHFCHAHLWISNFSCVSHEAPSEGAYFVPDNENDFDSKRALVHDRAIGRWENEGGSSSGTQPHQQETIARANGDAEAGNLRVRLIALENLVVALLAGAPESQSQLVREMAAYISPRAGTTPHRMTIEAARNMLALVERAAHYKSNTV